LIAIVCNAVFRCRLIEVTTSDPDWLGWDQYFKQVTEERSLARGILRFGNYVQAVQAALSGEGIMLGWRSVVGDLLKSQSLTIALNKPVHLDSGYYFRSTRPNEGARCASEFMGWLSRQASETWNF